jgi:thioredoxin-related protein
LRTRVLSSCILLAALALPLVLAGTRPAAAAPPPIAWRAWDRGLEEAKASGRPVLVNVVTDWCGWCRRMKAEVYTKPEIRDYLAEHFVMVTLNAEAADPAHYEGKALTSRSLAARFEVSGYPTTIFLRSDGGHLVNVPGYVEPAKFLPILRYIGDGHLERGVTFKEFSKQSSRARDVRP